jgi:hypothetical protein
MVKVGHVFKLVRVTFSITASDDDTQWYHDDTSISDVSQYRILAWQPHPVAHRNGCSASRRGQMVPVTVTLSPRWAVTTGPSPGSGLVDMIGTSRLGDTMI